MPELPWQTRKRLLSSYGLSEKNVDVLMKLDSSKDVPVDGDNSATPGPIQFFDELCQGNKRDPKVAFNWYVIDLSKMNSLYSYSGRMAHELLGQLTARKQSFQNNTITVQQLSELIDLVQNKQITGERT